MSKPTAPHLIRPVLLGILLGIELRSALGVLEELVALPNLPAPIAAEFSHLHHVLADWTAKTVELNAEL